MVGEALALDELLGHGVTGREEDSGGDGLGKERARGQLGLVPRFACVSEPIGYEQWHVMARDVPAKHLGRSVSLSVYSCIGFGSSDGIP